MLETENTEMWKNEILCIIDMQVDFVTGALKNEAAATIIPKIVKRINEFNGCMIVATRDTHTINYLNTLEGEKLPVEHCIKNTPGHCIVQEISMALLNAEKRGIKVLYLDKESFGSLKMDSIVELAPVIFSEQVPRITLVGTCTGICVLSNAVILKAAYPEIPVAVVADECACVTTDTHNTAIEAMRTLQIDIL